MKREITKFVLDKVSINEEDGHLTLVGKFYEAIESGFIEPEQKPFQEVYFLAYSNDTIETICEQIKNWADNRKKLYALENNIKEHFKTLLL